MQKPDPVSRPVSDGVLKIPLDTVEKGLKLIIEERRKGTLFELDAVAEGFHEARHQLLEGQSYDFEFSSNDFCFGEPKVRAGRIVQARKSRPHMGTLEPNIFVGTLQLDVCRKSQPEVSCGAVQLEVQSVKTGYRDDYRNMLEYITDRCTALLMQSDSPVRQMVEVDYEADYESLYQRFAFVRSVIGSDDFAAAVHRVVTAPVTGWREISEKQDVRRIRRFSASGIREITQGRNRQQLSALHPLAQQGIPSMPARVHSSIKTDSVDTPENRFIKYALESFAFFCAGIHESVSVQPGSALHTESADLVNRLESWLQHSMFREVSRPATLRINSPVLQRKTGYRAVLRAWLMFDLAAKLVWRGGDDVYQAGKKDIATLYEYWLFFQLTDLFSGMFRLEQQALEKLIVPDTSQLNLTLKQGKETILHGVFRTESRALQVRFSYNRTYSGTSFEKSYPGPGSWTTAMRPDYSLTVWPAGISEAIAEQEELIVHIHFDAKYKVENLADYLRERAEAAPEMIDSEKQREREGRYKNADLLKMHAYKDAIRRTGGAYVLYPGDIPVRRQGFHEIIPGLGAFPVKPSRDETGIQELRQFIEEVIRHFINRSSQREKAALKLWQVHREEPKVNHSVARSVPEAYGVNRDHIPDETQVLVGYCNRQEQFDWIRAKKRYNFRTDGSQGSLVLDSKTVTAKYLLIHRAGKDETAELWEIISDGPEVFSKEKLLQMDYPGPSQPYYLVIKIKKASAGEFRGLVWEHGKLAGYKEGLRKGLPFTVTLSELMAVSRKVPVLTGEPD
ncbi:hypothetical protein CYPRO_0853 [Cyclonatronum proteinivorum]|uniref:DUF2357 domain-containing protein n=1 Tax=Cyclonatronum proteinivorum TaxID=1457365 RepID=A0A345UI28_9BACT|nr:DUF2357 domain-containing protein [Cyclonatronum proteinivorum]AXJ00130.1 hypothetical protein CYPRO_0853 [Cyclonatronum proteinivorum]